MHDLGDVIPLTVEIRDATGGLAAAGAVTLTVTLPDATSVTPTVTTPSTGRYQYDFPTTQVGRHVVRWVATGANSSAYTDGFDVRAGDTGTIMSMSAAKTALSIPATSTGDDEEIRNLIEAVTGIVEEYRKEVIARRTVVEHLDVPVTGQTSRRLTLHHTPVLSVTSIVRPLDGATWTTADIVVNDPFAGTILTYHTPFYATPELGGLTATYTAGYAAIPGHYVEAAKVILQHLWQTRQTPGMGSRVFGDAISPGEARVMSGLGFAMPNRAAELLGGRGVFCV